MPPPSNRRYNYTARVVAKQMLTPRMCRVSLSCPEFAEFHHDNGINIKLYFDRADGSRASRAYTVSHFAPATLRLDIDFLLHEPNGIAADWAERAEIGSSLDIMGPRLHIDMSGSPQVLLLGDLCALPAISRQLARLPADAVGQALIAVPDQHEIIDLAHPAGVKIQWVVDEAVDALLPALAALPPDSWQQAFLWCTAESGVVRRTREYFASHGRPGRANTYLVGYWKQGLDEDSYHGIRHDEMDEA